MPQDRSLNTSFLIASAFSLSCAVAINRGSYSPAALVCLTAAIVTGLAALFVRLSFRTELIILGLALCGQLAFLLSAFPRDAMHGESFAPVLVCLALFAVAAALLLAPLPRPGRLALCALVLGYGVIGLWVLRQAPARVDVHFFQNSSARALLQGINPYGLRFPDPYSPELSRLFYGPGVSSNGVLSFGFPYPPLSLLLVLPGYLAGDIRYCHLVAILLTAVFIAFARPGRIAFLASALFLTTPMSFYILQHAWTEPLVAMLFAATVFCACRAPRLMPLVFGLFLASKQYTFIALPAALFLLPRPWRGRNIASAACKAIGVALLVTAPLALWNPREFFRSTVLWQFQQPFRSDALSYLPAIWDRGSATFVAFAVGIAMLISALGLWKSPRTPAGFATVSALGLLMFFAFNKQAFGNYYFFVIAALSCAIATAEEPIAQGS